MRRVLMALVVVVGLLVAGQGAVAAQSVDAPASTAGESPALADPGLILTNDEPARCNCGGGSDDGDSGGGGGELVP